MSQSFRPVKEIWKMHSSCFIESEELIALFHDLAARVGTASDEHEYGDNTQSGSKTATRFSTIWRQTSASIPPVPKTVWKSKG